jgi:hypothetical protein
MICKCGWKYDTDPERCPMCGTETRIPKKKDRSLKRKSRPNPVSKKRRKRSNQKEVFEQIARKRPKKCQHCGIGIWEWKAGNFDHILPKGKYPELMNVETNIQVLCCEVDMMQQPDIRKVAGKSCHYIKHNGTKEEWERKRGMFNQR